MIARPATDAQQPIGFQRQHHAVDMGRLLEQEFNCLLKWPISARPNPIENTATVYLSFCFSCYIDATGYSWPEYCGQCTSDSSCPVDSSIAQQFKAQWDIYAPGYSKGGLTLDVSYSDIVYGSSCSESFLCIDDVFFARIDATWVGRRALYVVFCRRVLKTEHEPQWILWIAFSLILRHQCVCSLMFSVLLLLRTFRLFVGILVL